MLSGGCARERTLGLPIELRTVPNAFKNDQITKQKKLHDHRLVAMAWNFFEIQNSYFECFLTTYDIRYCERHTKLVIVTKSVTEKTVKIFEFEFHFFVERQLQVTGFQELCLLCHES